MTATIAVGMISEFNVFPRIFHLLVFRTFFFADMKRK